MKGMDKISRDNTLRELQAWSLMLARMVPPGIEWAIVMAPGDETPDGDPIVLSSFPQPDKVRTLLSAGITKIAGLTPIHFSSSGSPDPEPGTRT